MLGWLVIALAVLGGLFYLLTGETGPLADYEGADRWGYIVVAVILALYALMMLAGNGRLAQSLKQLGIWVVIFLAIMAGYTFREDLSVFATRFAGELMPPGSTISETRSATGEVAVRIRHRSDGHFVARGEVNGANLVLLVDTGASSVVLKPADAERAGINVGALSFTVPVRTANGTGFAAPVRLRQITIGGITIPDVEALVARPGSLSENLLGMSFLRRLRSYEFSGDYLTLRG